MNIIYTSPPDCPLCILYVGPYLSPVLYVPPSGGDAGEEVRRSVCVPASGEDHPDGVPSISNEQEL